MYHLLYENIGVSVEKYQNVFLLFDHVHICSVVTVTNAASLDATGLCLYLFFTRHGEGNQWFVGFYHVGYEDPLLMVMRRKTVHG